MHKPCHASNAREHDRRRQLASASAPLDMEEGSGAVALAHRLLSVRLGVRLASVPLPRGVVACGLRSCMSVTRSELSQM